MLVANSKPFLKTLKRAKCTAKSDAFTFYGYNTISVIHTLDQLLAQPAAEGYLGDLGGSNIADIGAGDGDLGFYLESLGAQVDLIDYPPTNWNHMRGVRALKAALESNADIHEVDLDSQFRLPRDNYDLVFLLGILYHLKNPYYVLERLRAVSEKLVISTRIARYARTGGNEIQHDSVAYLVSPTECNNDATNYWIFSEAGLDQILSRCGWTVQSRLNLGDTQQSNPQDNDHDERIFMLLRRA